MSTRCASHGSSSVGSSLVLLLENGGEQRTTFKVRRGEGVLVKDEGTMHLYRLARTTQHIPLSALHVDLDEPHDVGQLDRHGASEQRVQGEREDLCLVEPWSAMR